VRVAGHTILGVVVGRWGKHIS